MYLHIKNIHKCIAPYYVCNREEWRQTGGWKASVTSRVTCCFKKAQPWGQWVIHVVGISVLEFQLVLWCWWFRRQVMHLHWCNTTEVILIEFFIVYTFHIISILTNDQHFSATAGTGRLLVHICVAVANAACYYCSLTPTSNKQFFWIHRLIQIARTTNKALICSGGCYLLIETDL